MANDLDSDLLRKLVRHTRPLLDKLSSARGLYHRQESPGLATIPALPHPRPIVSELLQRGVPVSTAQQLSKIYVKHAETLKHKWEQNLQYALSRFEDAGSHPSLNSLTESIQPTYVAQYLRALRHNADLMMEKATSAIHKSSEQNSPFNGVRDVVEKRPSFRQDALPELERTFRQNAYPTRAEKYRLAEQTGMELKQIQAWFQNKRNRLKRDSPDVRKFLFTGSHAHPTLPEYGINNTSTDSLCDAKYPTHMAVVYEAPRLTDAFNVKAPPHAFPGPYPPVCEYDPFPLNNRFPQFETYWPRYPGNNVSLRKTVLADVCDISHALEKTTLYTPHDSLHTSTEKHIKPMSNTACCPTVIVPPPAPLPALIRAFTSASAPVQGGHASPQCAIEDPSKSVVNHRQATPVVSGCSIQSHKNPAHALLHRVPKSLPVLVRDSSRPYLSSWSPHHRLRRSRTLSSTSLSSLPSGSMSPISSSPSSIDSPLVTPPQHLVDLPHPVKLSTSAFMLGPDPTLGTLFSSAAASPRSDDGCYLNPILCR